MTKQEIIQAIRNGEADKLNLRGADLKYADLSNLVLKGLELTGANLTGSTLNNCILTNVDFSYAILKNWTLIVRS